MRRKRWGRLKRFKKYREKRKERKRIGRVRKLIEDACIDARMMYDLIEQLPMGMSYMRESFEKSEYFDFRFKNLTFEYVRYNTLIIFTSFTFKVNDVEVIDKNVEVGFDLPDTIQKEIEECIKYLKALKRYNKEKGLEKRYKDSMIEKELKREKELEEKKRVLQERINK